jgi:hypothetical protein
VIINEKDFYQLHYDSKGRFREDEFYRWKGEIMAKKKKKVKKKKIKSKKKKSR